MTFLEKLYTLLNFQCFTEYKNPINIVFIINWLRKTWWILDYIKWTLIGHINHVTLVLIIITCIIHIYGQNFSVAFQPILNILKSKLCHLWYTLLAKTQLWIPANSPFFFSTFILITIYKIFTYQNVYTVETKSTYI